MAEYVLPDDLTRAYDAIKAKADKYKGLWQYYDGEQPLVYSMERLKKVFQDFKARFSQNWCSVVIDSALDRINLKSFDVSKDKTATDNLNKLWQDADMPLEAVEVHRAAQVTGEGFVIVWKDADGNLEAYSNDPRQVHVFYDEDNPRKASFAAKCWVDGKGLARITLYYPDRLEYYISTKKADDVTSAKAFKPDEPPVAQNPFKRIPVFHFRLERRRIKSALTNIVELQDAVNKLLADMMVAAEYGAFKQRFIISSVKTKGQLRNAPNEIWDVPAGDGTTQPTEVGQFEATDLANFFSAIDKLVYSIGIISRTPKHYFMAQNGDPSGEALIAMEAPLNKKCQTYIDNFIPVWRQIAAFMLELSGGQTVKAEDIMPMFDEPETVQPRTEAEIRALNTQAGIPIETTVRREGWTDSEIADMQKDKQSAPATNGGPSPPVDPRQQKRQQMSELRQAAREMMAGATNGNGNGTAEPAGA